MVLKTDFQRSDVNSQDPLNENFTLLEPLLEDTGWVDIPTVNDFTWARQCQARKIGNRVYLRGTLGATGSLDIKKPFAILPEIFRHNWEEQYRFNVAVASGVITKNARIYVKANGEMTVVGQTDTGGYNILDEISYLVD